MKKISAIAVLVFCWVHCQLTAQSYFDLNTGQYVEEEYICPTYQYVNESENGMTVSYSLGTLTTTEDELFPGTYNLALDKFGQQSVDGLPLLPMSNTTIQIPDGYTFVYTRLLDSSFIELSLELAPSRPPLSDNDTIGWQPDKIVPIFNASFSAPDSIIKFEYSGKKLGKNVCVLLIRPIQYDSRSKKVRIYKDFSFEIGLRPDNLGSDSPSDPEADYYTVQNTLIKRSYLILAPTEYKDAVQEFSLWKEKSGFNTINIYSENWTPSTIEATIDSVYNSTKTLQYVLLIGDHSKLPGKKFYSPYTEGGSYISDYEYSQIGSNLERSIYIGRIPGRNKEEVENALSKIIAYEITPPTTSKYYSQSLHSAYFQPSKTSYVEERRFVRTVEDIRNYVSEFGIAPQYNYVTPAAVSPRQWSSYYADGKDIPISLQRPHFEWDGNTANIVDFFKNGGCYALYRGHGTESSWHHPNFSMREIAQLPQTKNPPFVFSVTCLSGKYDLLNGGFAQSLICKKDGGCIGVIAASEVSYSGHNDALINGMFNHWFKGDGCYYHMGNNTYAPRIQISETGVTIGEILEAGIERMYEIFPSSLTSSSISNYTRNIFHIFGDPSMIVHSAPPTTFKGFNVNLIPGAVPHRQKPGFYNGTFSISIEDEGIISVIDAEGNKATCLGNKIDVKSPYFPLEVVITGQNRIPLFYTYYDPQGTGAPSSYNHWTISKLSPNPATDYISLTISYETTTPGISDSTQVEYFPQAQIFPRPNAKSLIIVIVSIDGKTSKSYTLPPKPQKWTQYIRKIPSGTYILSLVVDGVVTDRKTLIITH